MDINFLNIISLYKLYLYEVYLIINIINIICNHLNNKCNHYVTNILYGYTLLHNYSIKDGLYCTILSFIYNYVMKYVYNMHNKISVNNSDANNTSQYILNIHIIDVKKVDKQLTHARSCH